MLIDEPQVLQNSRDPIMQMIAAVNGNNPNAVKLQDGVYQIGHFGSSYFLSDYIEYPDVSVGPYGVCDSVEQLLEKCPELHSENRQFVVTVTEVLKTNQSSEGGWRWHKWGNYIGTHTPQHEYLYDEPDIDKVLCFHIYEKQTKHAKSAW